MRILWIKSELLHPVDKGGKIRTYQMLRSLARQHEVTYLCLDDGQAAADALQKSTEYAGHTIAVPFRPPAKGTAAFAGALFRNLWSSLPYAIARYVSPQLRQRVAKLAAQTDLLICDFLVPATSIPPGMLKRAVLFQHNVEAMIWQRRASVPQNPVRRQYMKLQWRRMRRFEAEMCRRFGHVVAVSESDAEVFRSGYGVQSVSHVRTGVDLDYFTRPADAERQVTELVFVGSMDWMPNEEGIRWFASDVFPLLQRRLPDTRLVVVGRAPTPALKSIADGNRGIEITGSVPDVRPYLTRASLSIVPLRIGGGTRLKIYEAMAMMCPVVSTTIGAEGLPVHDGQHLRIADGAQAQADAIVGLLKDPTAAHRLADTAREFVERHCSWDAVAADFLAQCKDAMS